MFLDNRSYTFLGFVNLFVFCFGVVFYPFLELICEEFSSVCSSVVCILFYELIVAISSRFTFSFITLW